MTQSLFDHGPSGQKHIDEMRDFAARMHPDIGPMFGRDVVALVNAFEQVVGLVETYGDENLRRLVREATRV